nr:putative ribonuclease H-like domain-containing protein [Tanacetum cinerariifolium]
IKREYSNARTLQQNRVDERKNRTLIEATRTMLAYSFLPTTFWKEAVNTACYVLNRIEPTSIAKALPDSSWVEAIKKAIGTKWVFRNKKDERGTVIGNKERLVAQGHRQEEGINYEEVFAPVERIEAIRLFLAYSSFLGFLVYQIDVKSAFLYGTIEEEVYVTQPSRFKDHEHPDKVYKVVKALYRMHQAPRECQEWIEGHVTSNKSVRRVNLLGNSKEVGTLRYLNLMVPLKKVGDEAVHKELGDRIEKAATTTSSLEVEQDSSGPRCQDTILGDVEAPRFEAASKQFNDPPLSRVNILGCGEDTIKLKELMDFCTKLSE